MFISSTSSVSESSIYIMMILLIFEGALIREGSLFRKSYFLEGRSLERGVYQSGRSLDHLR